MLLFSALTSCFLFLVVTVLSLSIDAVHAYPSTNTLMKRTDPVFPDQPASCPICAQNYPSISSCAQAAPVLANFSMVIFNPGAFIDVIKCACADTFQSAFPQCVDCFTKTNQTDVLNTPDLPGLVSSIRSICAIESTLLGNVSNANGETTPSGASIAAPTPTTSGGSVNVLVSFPTFSAVMMAGLLSMFSLGIL